MGPSFYLYLSPLHKFSLRSVLTLYVAINTERRKYTSFIIFIVASFGLYIISILWPFFEIRIKEMYSSRLKISFKI